MPFIHTPHSTDEQGNPVKQCCRCKRWHPLNYFYRDKVKWDGLVGWCKACLGKPTRERYVSNRLAEQDRLSKACSKCKQVKSKGQFTKNSQYSDGLSLLCRDCRREERKIR